WRRLLTSDLRHSVAVVLFTDSPPSVIYTLSLHDALPISWKTWSSLEETPRWVAPVNPQNWVPFMCSLQPMRAVTQPARFMEPSSDRKSTRLNSSHVKISYAVFCLKKKKTVKIQPASHTNY